MRKIKLYIAASIDGYIAGPGGDMDWLMEFPITSKENYGYDGFYETVDTVIMGGRTYREISCMPVVWPYKGKRTYIVTRNPMMMDNNKEYHYITENIIETVVGLKEKKGKDIWLVGGGELIAMLLDNALIDEMIITYIPTTLGNGIRLFPEYSKESIWTLKEANSYSNNVLQVIYSLYK